MSLYGDLPPPSKEGDTPVKKPTVEDGAAAGSTSSSPAKTILPAGWSSVTRFKPINRKPVPPKQKPAMRSIPVGFVSQSVTSMTTTVASTTAAITTKEPQNGVTTVYSAPTTVVSSTVTNTAQAPQQGGPMSLNDEYEVARPNEYEEFKELFENDRRQLEEEKRNFGRHGTGSGSQHYSRSRSRSRSSSPYRLRSRDNRSRSPSPPSSSSLVQNKPAFVMNDASGEEAFNRRAMLSQQRSQPAPQQHQAHPQFQQQQQRQQQPQQQQHRPAFVPAAQASPFKGAPSPVILLTNMVGPGEVDDGLQEETAAECEKFGAVVRCLIFEIKNRNVSPEEAVRIFVKFGDKESAERALKDLHGRFFGGRQVRGQFFDEARFDALQLAP
ncbi:hypothetical protein BKA57DRAFT_483248 [Linnemannia elongata]|nr:hypothetical protein BKA57DRAFT_483248 [Linnemannia elongata]